MAHDDDSIVGVARVGLVSCLFVGSAQCAQHPGVIRRTSLQGLQNRDDPGWVDPGARGRSDPELRGLDRRSVQPQEPIEYRQRLAVRGGVALLVKQRRGDIDTFLRVVGTTLREACGEIADRDRIAARGRNSRNGRPHRRISALLGGEFCDQPVDHRLRLLQLPNEAREFSVRLGRREPGQCGLVDDQGVAQGKSQDVDVVAPVQVVQHPVEGRLVERKCSLERLRLRYACVHEREIVQGAR